MSSAITLMVIYSEQMEECRSFYSRLGLHFEQEKHGTGPEHYAAVLGDGAVLEIYPANGKPTGRARIGLSLPGSRMVPPLESGDRKSTRLNSSHVSISYAVFC